MLQFVLVLLHVESTIDSDITAVAHSLSAEDTDLVLTLRLEGHAVDIRFGSWDRMDGQ